MNSIVRALVRAGPLLGDRRVLALVLVPLALAATVFTAVLVLLWSPLSHALGGALARGFGWSAEGGWVGAASGVLTFALLTLAVGAFVLAAIAVAAGPVFVRAVEARHFPGLERKRGGTLAGGIANALVAVAIWLLLWLLVLPLLLLPIVGVPASLALNAWLNQRLFRYDALADHASAAERVEVIRTARRRLFALGLALAPLTFVPLLNLILPLYAGLAFTCLCLDELAAMRERCGVAVVRVP